MSQHGCPERLSNRSKGFQEEGAQPTMEVLVETLTGTAFEMTVSPSDTIFAIKSKICRVEGIPISQQHLVYNLRELEDAMSLRSLGICDGARLRLVLGMRGGPISSRRLPPPPEPWRDIERLLDSNRDDGDWGCSGSGSGSGGSGCRVTVVVFREGERVNMLRVRENADGSYSPAEPPPPPPHTHTHTRHNYSPLTQVSDAGAGGGAGALQQNLVTMGKMMELRRRMETLNIRRHAPTGEKADIQKTRSEETLSMPRLLDEECAYTHTHTPYSEVLTDGNYTTRYEYECSFGDRYTLLPPIGARAASDQSVQDLPDTDRLQLTDALAGPYLVTERGHVADTADILEECRGDIPAPEYGPLVGGVGNAWRSRVFGSSSQLAHTPHAHSHAHPHSHPHSHAHPHSHPHSHAAPAHARSASSLHVRAPPPRPTPPLSSSTSDLGRRLLPALRPLARHRNTEQLHLSGGGGTHDAPQPATEATRRIEETAEPDARVFRFGDAEDGDDKKKEKKIKIRCGFCRKRLSIATVHRCRCGAVFCAPHRYAEVHGCAYDYKAELRAIDTRDLPSMHRLPKI